MLATILSAASWRDLPALPQAVGGAFAGTIGDQLVVAGGSYWRGAPWIPGSQKIYADAIYALTPRAKRWREFGKLPQPLGYGASFSHDGALWLVGGQNEQGAQRTLLRIDATGKVSEQGQLPEPLMMMAAAQHGKHFYLLGGQPNLRACLRSLDLTAWQTCPPWPGAGRFFAHATAAGSALYLAGGSDLINGKRHFLKDAYRLENEQWTKLPDLPVPVQAGFAAPHQGEPLILGGSDGTLADFEAELAADHPGFSTIIWRFDGQRWLPRGRLPYAPATSTLVEWRGEIVIPGGEDRPAHRSARVIAGTLRP